MVFYYIVDGMKGFRGKEQWLKLTFGGGHLTISQSELINFVLNGVSSNTTKLQDLNIKPVVITDCDYLIIHLVLK